MRNSGIRGAGYGLFLREKVNAGEAITLYRRKIISESTAKILKEQVKLTFINSIDFNNMNRFLLEFCPQTNPNDTKTSLFTREIDTFGPTMQLAAA